MAADYLLRQGHRSIAFVSPPEYTNDIIQHRIKGFIDKLAEYGLQIPKENRIVLESAIELESANKAVQVIIEIKQSVIAAFITSDQTAASIISDLTKRGIRVPKEISIVGFDNIPISVQTSPQLTTIAQDLEKKASLAVDILNNRMKSPNASAESHVLDIDLMIRDSVAKHC